MKLGTVVCRVHHKVLEEKHLDVYTRDVISHTTLQAQRPEEIFDFIMANAKGIRASSGSGAGNDGARR